jgi:hypothetical protein
MEELAGSSRDESLIENLVSRLEYRPETVPGLTAPYLVLGLALKLATQAAHFADVILVRQIMEKYAWQTPYRPHDEKKLRNGLFER